MFTAPNHRAPQRNQTAATTPDAEAVRQALAVLSRAMQPAPAPVAAPIARQPEVDDNARELAAWARIEKCSIYLTDPSVCPVSLPLRPQPGYSSLLSGKPAKRFVAEGFRSGVNKPVEVLVVPNYYTGDPKVVYAHGSAVINFKVVG